MAVVIAVPGNEHQATQLASRLGLEQVAAEVRQFPDGEIYVRIEKPDLAGHDAILVGSLYPAPAERFLIVAFLAATARDHGARKVGLVAPYLAFMRQDNQFKPGEGITSSYFARLVSSSVDWMVTVDPHLHRHHSLEGIYTIPDERRRGHATLSLGQISRHLLSSLPRLTLRVDDLDPGLAGVARKVGYVAGRAQRLVLMH